MDPQIDKWVVEATTAHEVGVGQWAGLRVQELAEWEDLGPRTPPPHSTPVDQKPLQGVLGGLIFRVPHKGLDKAFCLTPTFHSPSFLTLRMTPVRISAQKGGVGSGCYPLCLSPPRPQAFWARGLGLHLHSY